jgi:hypothetical protein
VNVDRDDGAAFHIHGVLVLVKRRAQKLRVGWVIYPQVFNSRIDVELSERDDQRATASFVTKVLVDLGLT